MLIFLSLLNAGASSGLHGGGAQQRRQILARFSPCFVWQFLPPQNADGGERQLTFGQRLPHPLAPPLPSPMCRS
jgi:hypothetical protein